LTSSPLLSLTIVSLTILLSVLRRMALQAAAYADSRLPAPLVDSRAGGPPKLTPSPFLSSSSSCSTSSTSSRGVNTRKRANLDGTASSYADSRLPPPLVDSRAGGRCDRNNGYDGDDEDEYLHELLRIRRMLGRGPREEISQEEFEIFCALSIPEELVPTPHTQFMKEFVKASGSTNSGLLCEGETSLILEKKDSNPVVEGMMISNNDSNDENRLNGSTIVERDYNNFVKETDMELEWDQHWNKCKMPPLRCDNKIVDSRTREQVARYLDVPFCKSNSHFLLEKLVS
jgi:hypothetical protein